MKNGHESGWMSDVDLKILSHLRRNGRESLMHISRNLGVPISYVFYRIRILEAKGIIRRHSCLPEWRKAGLGIHAIMLIKAPQKELPRIGEWLADCSQVNHLIRVNGAYSFVIEALFESIAEEEDFVEAFRKTFKEAEILGLHILEEVKQKGIMRERFGEDDPKLRKKAPG